jgi:two-component system NtrC family response regulator
VEYDGAGTLAVAVDPTGRAEVFAREKPLVVTLDLGLPPDIDGPSEGFRCLKAMLRENPDTKIIVLSGNDERENVLKAIELGAYDFYQKPIDLGELKVILRRAFNLAAIEAENRRLQIALAGEGESMTGMLGQCPQMQEVFAMVRRGATVDVPVLVLGESGTGKELVGRALHELSLRREQTFVPINCGAIPENLLESELFGHEKGAFTGAIAQRKGRFEEADGGTLFIDEVGDIPLAVQVKLLRAIQFGEIQRLGSSTPFSVDVRIIAATHRNLEEMIKNGEFREDLYYRLNVVSVTLPKLRERRVDIPLLIEHFIKKYAELNEKSVVGITSEALDKLMKYDYPGNVRELENIIEHAVVLCREENIALEDLPINVEASYEKMILDPHNLENNYEEKMKAFETELIQEALSRTNGNQSAAARLLNITERHFRSRLERLGLKRKNN